jgi:hypothetical protein
MEKHKESRAPLHKDNYEINEQTGTHISLESHQLQLWCEIRPNGAFCNYLIISTFYFCAFFEPPFQPFKTCVFYAENLYFSNDRNIFSCLGKKFSLPGKQKLHYSQVFINP